MLMVLHHLISATRQAVTETITRVRFELKLRRAQQQGARQLDIGQMEEQVMLSASPATIGGTSTARTLIGTLTDLNNYLDTASNITYLHGTPGNEEDDESLQSMVVGSNTDLAMAP